MIRDRYSVSGANLTSMADAATMEYASQNHSISYGSSWGSQSGWSGVPTGDVNSRIFGLGSFTPWDKLPQGGRRQNTSVGG